MKVTVKALNQAAEIERLNAELEEYKRRHNNVVQNLEDYCEKRVETLEEKNKELTDRIEVLYKFRKEDLDSTIGYQKERLVLDKQLDDLRSKSMKIFNIMAEEMLK